MSDFEHIKNASQAYYDDALARHGDRPEGVNWRDGESQELRFDVLAGVGNLSGKSVHDVGCGLAHFHDYLKTHAPTCVYTGSDISENMIAAARARIGDEADLHVADILAGSEPWMQADFIVNSGLFTVRGETPEEEWWAFVQSMIKAMFDLSRDGIAFNLMTSYVDFKDDHLFYKNPGQVLDFCVAELGRKAVIRHDYPLWEYMVYVYK